MRVKLWCGMFLSICDQYLEKFVQCIIIKTAHISTELAKRGKGALQEGSFALHQEGRGLSSFCVCTEHDAHTQCG